ncbi:Leucine-rich repeat-containing protein 48 [Phytophthora cinnamomi]|uniref:Leucine-rich repeat-containing protein 48 n=1 Tax=Phytophthora cinnamomi TaxID=4785 RepID=UPI003559B46B|nr:Leucine-rich repeat-containing protein 48 [Phytophthora cinnamomi]
MFSALRRSGSARVVSAVARSSVALHASPPQLSQALQLQTRTFLTSPRVTSYVMARAKLLHLAARTLMAYNQIMELDSAASPLSRYFAHSATLRDRVYMYLVCLIPPDQPIDLPEFLAGAKQAAHVVMRQIYAQEWAHNLGKVTSSSLSLSFEEVANQQCIDKWAVKLDAQREALRLPLGTTFKLEKLEVDDARLVEAEYEYSDAAEDQKNDTCSMYHMNEAVSMKVRFAATEHLLVFTSDGDDQPTRHTLKSTFDWSFYSDVSRARLVDWRITKATPFKLELTAAKGKMKTKVLAPM